MSFIGRLEEFFSQVIYPNRGPFVILVVLTVAAASYFAYRHGWHRLVRRHRGLAVAVLAVMLAVGLPLGWYLASPLFIRTELAEAAPPSAGPTGAVAARPSIVVEPRTSNRVAGKSPKAPTPAVTASATAKPLALVGQFKGADEFHFGKGNASLTTAEGGAVVRFEGFSVRNGPDLYVYLSPREDGGIDGALELGRLKATDGSFNYAVPSGTDVSRFRSVVVWCRQFSVLFATAPLSRS